MATLMAPGTLRTGSIFQANYHTDLVGAVTGVSGYGQQILLVDKSDATNYANIFGNRDTTNGRAVKIQYGDHAGTPTTLATFAKAAVKLELPLTVKQVDLTDPGTGYTSIGARASDGAPVFFKAGGSQVLLANAADSPSTILTSTGSIIYASGAGVAAERTIGSTNQVLTVSGGLPVWANGSKATMTGTGDLLTTSAANTLARVAIGTARQVLAVNSGATGLNYVESLQSLMTAQGDVLVASAANTPARVAIGTARQNLQVNSGATGLTYAASLQSLMTASGDIVYASGANTPARLAKGSDGQFLTLSSGVPAWTSGTTVRNVAGSAVGSTSGPTTTSASYADLAEMSVTITTTGGDILCGFSGGFASSTQANSTLAFSLDGAAEVGEILVTEAVANFVYNHALVYRFAAPSSASHTIKVRWKTGAGTLTANGTSRYMWAMET